jgi:hypothetical protein
LLAFVDALAKMFLTGVAEPPRDVHNQAAARGEIRYDRFLKTVGMSGVVRPWPRNLKATWSSEFGCGLHEHRGGPGRVVTHGRWQPALASY